MKKKLYKISIICLSLFAILLVIRVINLIQNKKELTENIYSNDYVVNKKDNLTMMLEKDYNSNQYELATSSEWPTDGYTFNAELSACKNGSKVSWDSETNRVIVYAGSIDSCYIYFDKEMYSADYIKNVVYTGNDGGNGLYYHDGVGSYTNAAQEAGDNSYRYAGANPNNYVCFGSDETTCPNDNLYRIIGVFGENLKLIKHDYANSNMLGTNGDYKSSYGSLGNYYKGNYSSVDAYYWNRNRSNTWSASQLNTVNLNTNYLNYLNNINSKWVDMIEQMNWQVGGMADNDASTTKQYYLNETGSSSSNTTYSAKIGLMYVSDYGYAASPANWNLALYNYSSDTNINNNWMYMGLTEWTISRGSNNTNYAFIVANSGYIDTREVYANEYTRAIRPTFYLSSNVAITDGDGSSSSPYRLEIA